MASAGLRFKWNFDMVQSYSLLSSFFIGSSFPCLHTLRLCLSLPSSPLPHHLLTSTSLPPPNTLLLTSPQHLSLHHSCKEDEGGDQISLWCSLQPDIHHRKWFWLWQCEYSGSRLRNPHWQGTDYQNQDKESYRSTKFPWRVSAISPASMSPMTPTASTEWIAHSCAHTTAVSWGICIICWSHSLHNYTHALLNELHPKISHRDML